MGKSKGRKLKARRDRPTGLPSMKEFEESVELTDQDCGLSTVQFVIEKLQSPAVGNKECAAYTIANMADKPELVSSLLENNVIKIAAPLLTDPSPAVRHAISGALRNFSTCGGHEVSKSMVEQDVMTPLVALLKEYDCSWAPVKLQENSKIDSKSAIFLEACNLLWNLCESSNTALSIFNECNIISILIRCLNVDSFGLDISLAIAQCLHTVAEDNPEAIHKLLKSSALEYLHSLISLELVEPPYILLRNLASGIVFNIYYGKISSCPTSTTTSLLDVVTYTLNVPVTPDLESLSKEISSYKEERKNKYRDEDNLKKKMVHEKNIDKLKKQAKNALDKEHKTNGDCSENCENLEELNCVEEIPNATNEEQQVKAISDAVKKLEHVLTAKQVALEIMTNICCGEDAGDDWDECGSSDTSDEMVMDVGEESFTDFKSPLTIPCEVHGVVVSQQLLEKVLDQIIIPSEEISQILQENPGGKDCLKRLHTLRCRALLCANNIIQGLNLEDLGGPSKLFGMWMNLANLVFKQTDSQDTEQLEAATSSLRAVLQKMAEENCSSHFQHMTESDLNMLTDICQQCQDGSVKVNIIRAIATLGCLLGNVGSPNALKLISNIGTFFIDVCVKNCELWVIAESLDAIFDVFAEDHLDPVVQEICLIEKLNNLLPLLKGKIKQQKKSLGQHFPVIMIAKTNLIRFIKYKSRQTRNNH